MTEVIRTFSSKPVRLALATIVLALAAGASLTVQAAPPHGGPGGPEGAMPMFGGPGHIEHMLDLVNASADQRSQVRAIMDAAHADLKARHDAAGPLQEQFATLFSQPTVDARAAEALRQQMLAQHDQASKRMMQAMLEVSRVLTPEQRQQMAAKMAERKTMMQRRAAGSGAAASQPKP